MLSNFIHVKLLKKEVIPGPVLPLGGFWEEEEGLGETRGALAPRCIGQGRVYAQLIGCQDDMNFATTSFCVGPSDHAHGVYEWVVQCT